MLSNGRTFNLQTLYLQTLEHPIVLCRMKLPHPDPVSWAFREYDKELLRFTCVRIVGSLTFIGPGIILTTRAVGSTAGGIHV